MLKAKIKEKLLNRRNDVEVDELLDSSGNNVEALLKDFDELLEAGLESGLQWVNGIKEIVYIDDDYLYLEDGTHTTGICIADDGITLNWGNNSQFIVIGEDEILFNGKPLGTKLYQHQMEVLDDEDNELFLVIISAQSSHFASFGDINLDYIVCLKGYNSTYGCPLEVISKSSSQIEVKYENATVYIDTLTEDAVIPM